MQKELTISISDETYQGLMELVGEKNANQFIESVLRRHIFKSEKDVIKLPPLNDNRTYRVLSPRLADPEQTEFLEVKHIKD